MAAGDIENAQAGHANAHARVGVQPGAPIVRAAVNEGSRHALKQSVDLLRRTLRADNAEYAAHRTEAHYLFIA